MDCKIDMTFYNVYNVTWRVGMGINGAEVTNTQKLELPVLICFRDKYKTEKDG